MNDIQKKALEMLNRLQGQILGALEARRLEDAEFYMGQYAKLAPEAIERFALEALVKTHQSDHDAAVEILTAGILRHPNSFDLLFNLGFTFQQKEEYLEAYNFYMRARYIAMTEEEREAIANALNSIGDNFVSSTDTRGDSLITIVSVGDTNINFETTFTALQKRAATLRSIENVLDANAKTVLELGFDDGVLAKNLNYYGYEVTALESLQERLLAAIVTEYHDNILQSEQKIARFYHLPLELETLRELPEAEIIIAGLNHNQDTFLFGEEKGKEALELLLDKAQRQLFIRVGKGTPFTEEIFFDVLDTYSSALVPEQLISGENKEFEIYLVNKIKPQKTFAVPQATAIQSSSSTIFEVELEKCRDYYATGYINDWHYFVAVLKEYELNPELEYKDSVLKKYYDTFHPHNLAEILFKRGNRPPELKQGWISYPWEKAKDGLRLKFVKQTKGTRLGGNHFHGPNTDKFGAEELARLTKLYQYFKDYPYLPEGFADGYISGYLLLKDDDYRFIVAEGQHRVAALAALGHNSLKCRLIQKIHFPQIVEFQNIKDLPQVKNGVFTGKLAEKLFLRFFANDVGRERIESSLN